MLEKIDTIDKILDVWRARDAAAACRAAGRTARRVNVTDSLMVRRDGPTASVTVRQHGRQLPLLLELFHNQSHHQVQMDMCDLLLG